jgi:hypothetical protein
LVSAVERIGAKMVRQEVAAPSAFPRPPAKAFKNGQRAGLPVAAVPCPKVCLKTDAIAVLGFLDPEAVRVGSGHGVTFDFRLISAHP